MGADAHLLRSGPFHRRGRSGIGSQRENVVVMAELRMKACHEARAQTSASSVDDAYTHSLAQPLTGCRHGKFAVFHTLHAHERIRHFSDFGPLPFGHKHLETMVMIEMYVHPGHDMALEVVLDLRQFS